MPRVSGKRIGNMTEDVQWGKGGGQYDSWMERGGRGCRVMEKGEWPKGQRLEVTLCQKKKCCSGEKDGNTLSS